MKCLDILNMFYIFQVFVLKNDEVLKEKELFTISTSFHLQSYSKLSFTRIFGITFLYFYLIRHYLTDLSKLQIVDTTTLHQI